MWLPGMTLTEGKKKETTLEQLKRGVVLVLLAKRALCCCTGMCRATIFAPNYVGVVVDKIGSGVGGGGVRACFKLRWVAPMPVFMVPPTGSPTLFFCIES